MWTKKGQVALRGCVVASFSGISVSRQGKGGRSLCFGFVGSFLPQLWLLCHGEVLRVRGYNRSLPVSAALPGKTD